jgi:N-methylhydantoinase A
MSNTTSICRIGADIGGTFTDVAAVDNQGRLHIGKRLTTHGSEHEGVIQAVSDTGVDTRAPGTILAHGTTLVINALLERRGARVALVTTEGFADVLDIGRGNRSEIFTLRFRRSGPLVPREMRYEMRERAAGDGHVERVPSEAELKALVAWLREVEAEAVAIGFLHSYVKPDNERLVADYLRKTLPELPVTLSSDLSRQWREFERFTTASANAYIAPVADRYLKRLIGGLAEDGFRGDFIVLDSSGGAMAVETATRFPVRAVESGPVGGVIGARALAAKLKIDHLLSFDLGGTTAKSALVEGGEYATRDLYWIGGERRGFPLQVSTVDIIEIGVGGGSIAWLNSAGTLQIGPRSAGSQPGPVCYGLGGTDVTLTDANLYCGRIDKDHFAGTFKLDLDGSQRALRGLAERAGMDPERLALGIIRLANLRMASMLRRQTLELGNDPRQYTLLASGGGGPLHACEVAAEVGIERVLVPRFPGHYSALGMLSANLRLDRREVWVGPIAELDPGRLRAAIDTIVDDLARELKLGGASAQQLQIQYYLAVRFKGQEHPLWIPAPQPGAAVPDDIATYLRSGFEKEYERRYGHVDRMSPVETAELQVVAERLLPPVAADYEAPAADPVTSHPSLWSAHGGRVDTPVIARTSLSAGAVVVGPAVLHEIGSTTAIPPGARAEVQADGVIIIDVRGMRT